MGYRREVYARNRSSLIMSATVYGVLQWCELAPEEITGVINKIKNGYIYNGLDFYNEIKKRNAWTNATYPDDSVMIWSGDDAGPITVDGKDIGLFVHFDEEREMFDWACTYKL